jgi:serine/threonine protein kinase
MSHPPIGHTPEIGARFGHYLIEQQLGAGGMGAVFLARDLRPPRQVAIKVLLGHAAQDPSFLQRFEREAAVLARLDSPHVISIYDHGQLDGWPYLVTQYAPGGDLGRLIRERGPMPPGLATRVCSQVADALVAAHAVGVIHRDVKPENVLIRDSRLEQLDRMHVYLGDFGVAHTESTGLTTAGAVAGTWNYLAPERAQGSPGSPATDIYSVGCLLWEVLTGRPPYAGSDVEVAMAHLQDPVPQLPVGDDFAARANQVIARAMAKDPSQRPATALELREEIRALAPQSVSPSFSGQAPLPRHLPGRRRWRRIALALGAFVLVGGGVAAALVLPGGSSGNEDPTPSAEPKPTDPTVEPDPPAPVDAVTGDLDGDGLGDLGYVVGSSGAARIWPSTGEAFGPPQRRADLEGDVLEGDVTGDGRSDLLDVQGTGSVLAANVFSGGPDATVSPVRAPDGYLNDVLLVADFDGDGHDDLAAAAYGEGRIELVVSLGTETGAFVDSRRWFVGGYGQGDDIALAAGDLDADGRGDVALIAFSGGTPRLRLLSSTGTGFEMRGPGTEAPGLEGSSGFLRVADLEGDDRPELVYVPRYTYDEPVKVWRPDEGFQPVPGWTVASQKYLASLAVSDLDGDGRDDLVLWADDDGPPLALAVLSRGDGFAIPRTWLRDQNLGDYGYSVGAVSDNYWYGYL